MRAYRPKVYEIYMKNYDCPYMNHIYAMLYTIIHEPEKYIYVFVVYI